MFKESLLNNLSKKDPPKESLEESPKEYLEESLKESFEATKLTRSVKRLV